MKFSTTTFIALVAVFKQSSAFAPSQIQLKTLSHESQIGKRTLSTIIYSTGEEYNEENSIPTPQNDALSQQAQSFTNEPKAPERLDPLVQALTKMDEKTANAPTKKLPLLGEVPVDGSLLVLAPVALIAVAGFIMSMNIAFQSKDLISQQLDEINAVLTAPPVKQTVVKSDECRGLCSDQNDQLDTMKGFMEGLSKKKASMIEEPKPVVVPVVVKPAPVPAPPPVVVEAPVAVQAAPELAPAPEPIAAAPVVVEPIGAVAPESAPVMKEDSSPAATESAAVIAKAEDVVPTPEAVAVVRAEPEITSPSAAPEPAPGRAFVTDSESIV